MQPCTPLESNFKAISNALFMNYMAIGMLYATAVQVGVVKVKCALHVPPQ